jgi:hypothetical protein
MWMPQAEPRPMTWARPTFAPVDLAVARLAAQVVADLPHVGDAGGGDRMALRLQAARHVDRHRTVTPWAPRLEEVDRTAGLGQSIRLS